jgi:hypothetical protein
MSGGQPQRVSPAEIADLLAWARSVTEARPAADPAQRATYLAAKAELLARIADQHSCHTATTQRVTTDARTAATQPPALLPTPDEDLQ